MSTLIVGVVYLKKEQHSILGTCLFVFRSATKKEIMRSYRKLAVQWHPDHYEGDDKKKAEKMFIDIAAAKEVLSDPGRKIYLASNFV